MDDHQTMYTFIYRHSTHTRGRWLTDSGLYESREQAIAEAGAQWDGTGVTWRLLSIPGVEVAWTGHYPQALDA